VMYLLAVNKLLLLGFFGTVNNLHLANVQFNSNYV
jgi:hypothetical protein